MNTPLLISSAVTFNDWLQWGTVIAIIVIAALAIIRKTVRFRKQLKSDKGPGCGCDDGCCGCRQTDCALNHTKHRDHTPESH